MAEYFASVTLNSITHICMICACPYICVNLCCIVLSGILTWCSNCIDRMHIATLWPVELLLLWLWKCPYNSIDMANFDGNQQRSYNLCLFVMLFNHHYLMNHPNANFILFTLIACQPFKTTTYYSILINIIIGHSKAFNCLSNWIHCYAQNVRLFRNVLANTQYKHQKQI